MFDQLDGQSKELIFIALKKLIESGEGHGFHNADQNHPIYMFGAKGREPGSFKYVDSPDKNRLFQMLKTLSEEKKKNEDTGYVWWYDFSTWENFCNFSVESYKKAKK